jgi:hypothetical protein
MKEGIKVAVRRTSTIQNSALIIHNFSSILSGSLSLITEICVICGQKFPNEPILKIIKKALSGFLITAYAYRLCLLPQKTNPIEPILISNRSICFFEDFRL